MDEIGIPKEIVPRERRYALLGFVRRELIFQGDLTTYKYASEVSNRIEHGYGTFAEIWSTPFEIYERTAKYVREAIFELVSFDAASRTILSGSCYAEVLPESTPPTKVGVFRLEEGADWYALYKPHPKFMTVDEAARTFTIVYGDDALAQ